MAGPSDRHQLQETVGFVYSALFLLILLVLLVLLVKPFIFSLQVSLPFPPFSFLWWEGGG